MLAACAGREVRVHLLRIVSCTGARELGSRLERIFDESPPVLGQSCLAFDGRDHECMSGLSCLFGNGLDSFLELR